jgi:hypothetical protein
MLKELFENNKNIVINTDIDGVLSGALLVKYFGCKVVGFTNSKDTVWLADDYDNLYENIYIDMFVTDDRAICIDQHVVAINDKHLEKIRNTNNKHNPQIENGKNFTADGFKTKYPFGTIQYLIAQIEKEGITVEFPNLFDKIDKTNLTLCDFILRADDAMKTTAYAYKKNAETWWKYLKDTSNNSEIINSLKQYIDNKTKNENGTSKDKKTLENEIENQKVEIKEYFKKNFQCRTGDGGFKNITDENGNLLPNIKNYITKFFTLVGCEKFEIIEHYNLHKGKYYSQSWIDLFEKDLIDNYLFCGHKIFSYAFIYSPNCDGINFSFTIDLE